MQTKSENLNYSPQTLRSKFSYYRGKPLEADTDGYSKDSNGKVIRAALQENIANKAYGGRNGNVAPGDGWLYRGRGLKQLTGKTNYNDYTIQYKWYWKDTNSDFLAFPDLLTQAIFGIRSAIWFWISKSCMRAADKGAGDSNIDSVTAIVNRGELGHADANGIFTLVPGSAPANRREYVKSAFKILS